MAEDDSDRVVPTEVGGGREGIWRIVVSFSCNGLIFSFTLL